MIGSTARLNKQEFLEENSLNNENKSDFEKIGTLPLSFLKRLMDIAPVEFGERGASGIAFRIGEASFRCFLRKEGKEYSLTDNSYRLMNPRQRIMFGLSQLVEFANNNCDARIHVSENDKNWFWKVKFENDDPNSHQILSAYTLGLLREFFSWSSGGRYYPMEGVLQSSESSNSYIISISKQPLEN